MLKTLITALIGLVAFSVNAQNSYYIKGKISTKYDDQMVMLEYYTANHQVKDSAVVKNGSFTFKGSVNEVVKAYLDLKIIKEIKASAAADGVPERNYQTFFLENKNFSIIGPNLFNAIIKGGAAQTDNLLLRSQLSSLKAKEVALTDQIIRNMHNKKAENANEQAPDPLASQLGLIENDMAKIQDAFIQKHPDSYVSLDLVNEKNEGAIETAELRRDLNSLSPRMKNTTIGKNLQAKLTIAERIDIGQKALDFTQNNTMGQPVSLSSLRGKYVLVDFWASWCAPCREENPEVLKAYQKFKDKKFEIISVSLDSKKEPWLKAIQTDGLPWLQVSDLKGWKNEVAKLYGVTSVPQNFLLDPDGKIVAKNLRGEELQKELAKIFNQ